MPEIYSPDDLADPQDVIKSQLPQAAPLAWPSDAPMFKPKPADPVPPPPVGWSIAEKEKYYKRYEDMDRVFQPEDLEPPESAQKKVQQSIQESDPFTWGYNYTRGSDLDKQEMIEMIPHAGGFFKALNSGGFKEAIQSATKLGGAGPIIKWITDKMMVDGGLKAAQERDAKGQATDMDRFMLGQAQGRKERQEGRTFNEKILNGVIRSVSMGAEIASTGGVYSGAKSAAGGQLVTALGSQATTLGGRAALATVPRLAGVLAQSAARPGSILGNASDRAMHETALSKPDVGRVKTIITSENKNSTAYNLGMGYLDTVVETAAERSGEILGKAIGGTASRLGGKLISRSQTAQAVKAAIVSRYLKMFPKRGVDGIEAALRKASGWSGPINEMLEERAQEIPDYLTGKEKNAGATGHLLHGRWGELGKQLTEEAATFLILGAGFKSIDLAQQGYDESQGIDRKARPSDAEIEDAQFRQYTLDELMHPGWQPPTPEATGAAAEPPPDVSPSPAGATAEAAPEPAPEPAKPTVDIRAAVEGSPERQQALTAWYAAHQETSKYPATPSKGETAQMLNALGLDPTQAGGMNREARTALAAEVKAVVEQPAVESVAEQPAEAASAEQPKQEDAPQAEAPATDWSKHAGLIYEDIESRALRSENARAFNPSEVERQINEGLFDGFIDETSNPGLKAALIQEAQRRAGLVTKSNPLGVPQKAEATAETPQAEAATPRHIPQEAPAKLTGPETAVWENVWNSYDKDASNPEFVKDMGGFDIPKVQRMEILGRLEQSSTMRAAGKKSSRAEASLAKKLRKAWGIPANEDRDSYSVDQQEEYIPPQTINPKREPVKPEGWPDASPAALSSFKLKGGKGRWFVADADTGKQSAANPGIFKTQKEADAALHRAALESEGWSEKYSGRKGEKKWVQAKKRNPERGRRSARDVAQRAIADRTGTTQAIVAAIDKDLESKADPDGVKARLGALWDEIRDHMRTADPGSSMRKVYDALTRGGQTDEAAMKAWGVYAREKAKSAEASDLTVDKDDPSAGLWAFVKGPRPEPAKVSERELEDEVRKWQDAEMAAAASPSEDTGEQFSKNSKRPKASQEARSAYKIEGNKSNGYNVTVRGSGMIVQHYDTREEASEALNDLALEDEGWTLDYETDEWSPPGEEQFERDYRDRSKDEAAAHEAATTGKDGPAQKAASEHKPSKTGKPKMGDNPDPDTGYDAEGWQSKDRKGRPQPTTATAPPSGQTADPRGTGLPGVEGVELEELLLFAEEIGELRVAIARKLQGKGILGKFKYMTGFGKGFMSIFINPDAALDPIQLARTVAHEIGHMIDFLGENTFKRGNILGRLKGVRDYFQQYLEAHPGAEKPLTEAEIQAIRDSVPEPQGPEAERQVEREIREEHPVTSDDIIAIWNSLDTSHLSEELKRFVARMSAVDKLRVVRDAMKGIVSADLQQFSTSTVIGTETVTIPGRARRTRAEVEAEIHAKMEAEIQRRALISLRRVMVEAMDLSAKWREWSTKRPGITQNHARQLASDEERKYRDSGEELYADMLSVFLLDPALLQQEAPEFYRGLLDHFKNAKPEVWDAYFELQSVLSGDPKVIYDARMAKDYGAVDAGAVALEKDLAEKKAAKLSFAQKLKQTLGQYFYSKVDPISSRMKTGKRAVADRAKIAKLKAIVEELGTEGTHVRLFAQDVQKQVLDPLKAAGVDERDLGVMMRYESVLGSRKAKANPLGTTPRTAQKNLEYMEKQFTPEQWKVMKESAAKFHDLVFSVMEKAYQVGIISDQLWNEVIVPNKGTYVTHVPLRYVSSYVPATMKEAVGTFEAVGNTFTFTAIRALSVIKLTQHLRLKNAARDYMTAFEHADYVKVDIPFGHKKPIRKPRPGRDYIYHMENGKVVAYETPKAIANSFNNLDLGAAHALAMSWNSMVYGIFHNLYVTYSPGFLVKNPFRDITRTYTNLGAWLDKKAAEVYQDHINNGATKEYARAEAHKMRLSVGELVSELRKARPKAWKHAQGEEIPEVRELLESAGVSGRYTDAEAEAGGVVPAEILGGVKPAFGDVVEKWSRGKPLKSKWFAVKVMGEALGWVHNTNESVEMLTKLAAHSILEKRGIGKEEAAYAIREYVGTPNWKKGGFFTPYTNGLFLYHRVALNGLMADAELALGKGSAGSWWLRKGMTSLLPTTIMRMAMLGFFGAAVKWLFGLIPKYYLDNYIVIPVGYTEDEGKHKALFLTVPKDQTGQATGKAWNALLDIAFQKMGQEGREVGVAGASQTVVGATADLVKPDFVPPITIIYNWAVFMGGGNPSNPQSGKPIVKEKNFKAGGLEAAKPMTWWTVDQLGVVGSVAHVAMESVGVGEYGSERTTETTWKAVPGLSSLLRLSGGGEREEQWQELEKEASDEAAFKLGLPKSTQDLTQKRYYLSRLNKGPKGLSKEDKAQRLILNAWYSETYSPAVEEIKQIESQGGDSTEIREKLDAEGKLLNKSKPSPEDVAPYRRIAARNAIHSMAQLPPMKITPSEIRMGKTFASKRESYKQSIEQAAEDIDALGISKSEAMAILNQVIFSASNPATRKRMAAAGQAAIARHYSDQ